MTEWEKLAQKIESEEWRDLAASIAVTVITLLDQHNMNKQQLADKMGVKPQYVSRIVKGKANLTLDTIAKLEKALGESIVTISDPTALISATSVMIAPNTVWKNFYETNVSGSIASSSGQSKNEYFSNDDYALAS